MIRPLDILLKIQNAPEHIQTAVLGLVSGHRVCVTLGWRILGNSSAIYFYAPTTTLGILLCAPSSIITNNSILHSLTIIFNVFNELC